MENDENCAICYCELDDEEQCYSIEPCGHRFHTKCIIDWFRRASTCPSCRDNTVQKINQIPCFVLRERAKELRKISRRINAPKDLKNLVERVKISEQKLKEKNNELKEYRKEHKEILSKERKLSQAKYNLRWAKTKNERLLGVYHSNSYPLPNLIVNNYQGIPI